MSLEQVEALDISSPPMAMPGELDPTVLLEHAEGGDIEEIIATIERDPRFDDKETSIMKNITDQLKVGNVFSAITQFFDFLGGVLGSSTDEPFEYFGDDILEVSNKTIRWLNNIHCDSNKLEKQIQILSSKIEQSGCIKRKLAYCAAMTECKNALFRSNPENRDLAMEQDPAERMKFLGEGGFMKAGDVLLVNKSPDKRGFGDRLLTETTQGDINFSHSMLVSRVDKDGTVWVTHSTMKKKDGTSGVEELKLSDYIDQFGGPENTALAVLSPPNAMRKKLVADVQSKIGKGYDKGAALSKGVLGTNLFANNDSYNCVELIAQHIPNNTVRQFTHPSQFLSSKLFTPTYMSIGCWLPGS